MKINVTPPINLEQAENAVKTAELIWNSGDIKRILNLFSDRCEWRDNDRQIMGKKAIAKFLEHKIQAEIFYQVRAELWNYSHFQISASFQSEWQEKRTQLWLRTSGHVFSRLDKNGLIREFSLSTSSKTISLKDRVFTFDQTGEDND